jgi:hypothetical protein
MKNIIMYSNYFREQQLLLQFTFQGMFYPVVVVHGYNSSPWEAEAGILLVVQVQSGPTEQDFV